MDRTALLAYLNAWYPEAIAEAGLLATDVPTGLGPVLDAVQEIVDDQPGLNARWHKPLAKYYLLSRLVNVFNTSFDVTLGDNEGSYRLNQLYTNLKKELDSIYGQVRWIVDPEADDGGLFGDPITVRSRFLMGSEDGAEW